MGRFSPGANKNVPAIIIAVSVISVKNWASISPEK